MDPIANLIFHAGRVARAHTYPPQGRVYTWTPFKVQWISLLYCPCLEFFSEDGYCRQRLRISPSDWEALLGFSLIFSSSSYKLLFFPTHWIPRLFLFNNFLVVDSSYRRAHKYTHHTSSHILHRLASLVYGQWGLHLHTIAVQVGIYILSFVEQYLYRR